MKISFSPQFRSDSLAVTKAGDILTINGEAFDFSVIPEGATLPAEAVDCEFVVGEVNRQGGELSLTLVLPHGPNPSSAVAFPAPLVSPPDGPVAVPFDPPPPEPPINDLEPTPTYPDLESVEE